jgi:uncharacterized protein (TIGR02246 family)
LLLKNAQFVQKSERRKVNHSLSCGAACHAKLKGPLNHKEKPAMLRSIVLGLLMLAGSATISFGQNPDESKIRALQDRQAIAWNQHDGKAYADLFTEDGEVINVVGWWWKGKVEIAAKLTAAFAFVFKDSTLTITDTQVRFVKPDVAIAHVKWTMTGARTPPGIPEPKQGIEIQVLKKQRGKWLIFSFQNTASIPEMPFPLGPPKI